MGRTIAALLIAGLLLSVSAGAALGHEAEGGEETLAVEPSSITAGDRVVLAGSGFEPETDRVLVLAGSQLVVEFGTVRTDAEGMFRQELVIPAHLPSGTYELRAIGDETLTASLAVTGANADVASVEPEPAETIVARERSSGERALILAVIVVTALTGSLLAFRSDRGRAAATG